MADWPLKQKDLSPPSLQELIPILQPELSKSFRHSQVEVVSCPDLTLPPYNLASPGLGGNPKIADIGGPPNLSPVPDKSKKYSLLDMRRLLGMSESAGLLTGAAAGPFHVLGVNSELMPNISYEGGKINNQTRCARIVEDGTQVCGSSPSLDFGLMANLFACDGLQGDVLKITAKARVGEMNFTQVLQKALRDHYGSRVISVGGVFVVKKGRANLHVMPDFSKTPLKTRDDVDAWLRYFDVDSPLTCLSVFHSAEPDGWALRMEHTHCFSESGGGGHYHGDVTPDEVEYEAYFNLADVLYRIDQPGLKDDLWNQAYS